MRAHTMRTAIGPNYVKVWLSADDTYRWANRPGARWPCSTLAGHRMFAEFDANGLCDFTLDGGRAGDIDGNEFNACVSDMLSAKLPEDHPCYFVAVGQFQTA